ncbi:MAG: pyridoxal 5'-phosphate synthase glutaminase subunit PdxT [Candidatus Peribacteraceae bacterium]|jgi:5'-phosphate synthase pdxT subunit|nr:pyridoxal 5'-phosphate synthase glutaminase subunit PdxT [Candidatus Peribacteraceae bacterium]|tara:strand:- start:23950 stop:24534 length:585 start_codon:yes stop_codon:yes gene_type:complete
MTNDQQPTTGNQQPITIGVLALQGDFAEHKAMLAALKIRSIEIRSTKDLEGCDALIIPGGESTVMMKLLKETGLDQSIIDRVRSGMSIFGTCAGAIVLSDSHLKLMDISVERNAYGSQLQSFSDQIDIKNIGSIEATFIRAPIITHVGQNVSILATHNDHPVLVQQGNIVASTFHPEVRSEMAIHQLFVGCLHY